MKIKISKQNDKHFEQEFCIEIDDKEFEKIIRNWSWLIKEISLDALSDREQDIIDYQ